jgi:hypothetical protein
MTTHVMPDKWRSFDGTVKEFKDIDIQHLCNILWFNEVFRGWNRYNSAAQFALGLELATRNNDIRLMWKPLPIPSEIEDLVKMGLVKNDGSIIGNQNCAIYEGKKIGSITHIENWQSFLL